LPTRKRVADVALLASIVVSISFSTLTASKLLTSQTAMSGISAANNANSVLEQVPPAGQREGNAGQLSSDANSGSSLPPSQSDDYSAGGYAPPDDRLVSPSTGKDNLSAELYSTVDYASPFILPITWGAVAGTLIWRGKVRSQWCKQGYDYETFRLLARMKGSPVRVALLTSVSNSAKTRAQLAEDLHVDWKTIDNHIDVLSKYSLVQEIGASGTSKYFAITEHGNRVLALLMSADSNGIAGITGNPYGRAADECHELDTQRSLKSSLN
jgi:hypothetical protein